MKPMKLIGWGILVIVAVIAVVFAINNHTAQIVDFWPLPYSLNAPLYAVVIGALAVGFVLGAVASWIGGHRWRKLARQRKRQNDTLMRELDGFKAKERERALATPAEPSSPIGTAGPADERAAPRAIAGRGG